MSFFIARDHGGSVNDLAEAATGKVKSIRNTANEFDSEVAATTMGPTGLERMTLCV
jgi:hypothetical protein